MLTGCQPPAKPGERSTGEIFILQLLDEGNRFLKPAERRFGIAGLCPGQRP